MLHNIKFNNVRMDAQEHAQQLRDASRIIESLNTYIRSYFSSTEMVSR